MRFSFICAIFLGLALSILPASALQWLIVAVPQTSGKDGQILHVSQPFQVILTNAALRDVKFQSVCNLFFEFKSKDEKIVKIEKNPQFSQFKNSSGEVVRPGCAYSIAIDFSNTKEWSGVKNLSGKMTMRVIYENFDKAFSRSDPIQVTIVR